MLSRKHGDDPIGFAQLVGTKYDNVITVEGHHPSIPQRTALSAEGWPVQNGRMTVLITGGTGTLGSELRRQLQSAGHDVRVFSRRERPAGETSSSWATGDLATGSGLDAALDGIRTIVHCASDGRTDLAAAQNLVTAARRAEVTHLAYISIVGVDKHPFPYYRTKHEVERLIEASGIPWTILRATQFHHLVFGLFRAQRPLPVLFTPAFAFQPIAVSEVATRLGELTLEPPVGRAPDVAGPKVCSGTELAKAYLMRAHSNRRIVPLWLPGKTFAAFAAGVHLAPENRYGTVTFAEFLTTRVVARKRQR